jgi:hypothetical protein
MDRLWHARTTPPSTLLPAAVGLRVVGRVAAGGSSDAVPAQPPAVLTTPVVTRRRRVGDRSERPRSSGRLWTPRWSR